MFHDMFPKKAMLICDFIYATLLVPLHAHPFSPNFLLYYLSWISTCTKMAIA